MAMVCLSKRSRNLLTDEKEERLVIRTVSTTEATDMLSFNLNFELVSDRMANASLRTHGQLNF